VPFGSIATVLMVLGGAGAGAGAAHRRSPLFSSFSSSSPPSKCISIWLGFLPGEQQRSRPSFPGEPERSKFRLLQRHAIHAHETGWQEEPRVPDACLYFLSHGSAALSWTR